jgi:copper resistance protein D
VASLVPGLNVLVAVLADSSYVLLVGASLARYWLRSAGGAAEIPDFRMHRFRMVGLGVLVFCHLVRPWFVASSMSGSTEFGQALVLVPTILSSTRQGGLWYTNSAVLAVLFAVQFFARARPAPIAEWIAAALLCALAAIRAASSHASEEGDFSLAEISQFVHLMATSIWAGAIVVSGFLIIPRLAALNELSTLWAYGGRLSATVTWAVGTLLLSGLYTSWRDMHGTFHVLWTSDWGKTLLAKGAFVGIALLLGSLTRFRCLARPPVGGRAILMTRLVRSEALVMLVILSFSGLLANTSPGT